MLLFSRHGAEKVISILNNPPLSALMIASEARVFLAKNRGNHLQYFAKTGNFPASNLIKH